MNYFGILDKKTDPWGILSISCIQPYCLLENKGTRLITM